MEMKVTLIGMEQYLNSRNDSLFSNLTLPEGIEKETFVDNLLLTCGEFEPLYSNADYMKHFVKTWGDKWYLTFDKWYKGLHQTYDPIANYDRIEDIQDTTTTTHTGTTDTTGSGSDTTTQTFNSVTDTYDGTVSDKPLNWATEFTPSTTDTVSTDITSEELTRTTETQVSGYDSSSYVNSNKVTESVEPKTGGEGNTTTTTSHTGYDTTTQTGQYDVDNDYTNTRTGSIDNTTQLGSTQTRTDNLTDDTLYTHSAHITGNIGTLTTQAMIESELSLYKFNIYNEMTDLFATELLILIY